MCLHSNMCLVHTSFKYSNDVCDVKGITSQLMFCHFQNIYIERYNIGLYHTKVAKYEEYISDIGLLRFKWVTIFKFTMRRILIIFIAPGPWMRVLDLPFTLQEWKWFLTLYRIESISNPFSGFLPDARSEFCSDPRSPHQIFQYRGTIQSPGYPDYYNANENCEWNLSPPVGRVPQLLITSLVLETGVGYGDGETCTGVENYVTIEGSE